MKIAKIKWGWAGMKTNEVEKRAARRQPERTT